MPTPERLRCTATTSRSKTSSGRGRSLRCANKGPKQAFEHLPLAGLKTHLTKAIVQGRRIHYLPPYRGETKLLLADLPGTQTGRTCTITSRSS